MAGQQKRKLPEKGYRGPYERYKSQLEDNGAEIMMHGDEIYLREWSDKGWLYTHWPAKRGVLLYNWLAPYIDELRELAGDALPMPEEQQPDPESFAGLLAQITMQSQALADDLGGEDEDREHPLNPLLQSWLLQLQTITALKGRKTR